MTNIKPIEKKANQDVVRIAEELLAKAKSGEIIAVKIIADCGKTGFWERNTAFSNRFEAAGILLAAAVGFVEED